MKDSNYTKSIITATLMLIAFVAFAVQDKVIQIFRNGEIIQEFSASDIDYIEVNDRVSIPQNIFSSVSDKSITISWDAVDGATYKIYRSADNVTFSLLASDLTETTYTDATPLSGSNYYRVKAVIAGVESGYTSSVSATFTSSEMKSGIYLGITGFNQFLYEKPIILLTENSAADFRNFIDDFTMKYGTLLYYSVDQAINAMQSAQLPSNTSTAAIVTFTDGLDQGSMIKDVPYEDDIAYLDALNKRITNEKVAGLPLTAFSIGLRGSDLDNDASHISLFRENLAKLASSSENATEVTSMEEVNTKFQEIASKLSQSNYIQTINLKIPAVSNGTLIRFTFDNAAKAENSKIYIEGKFNLKARALEEIKYVGLTSTSGSTINGSVDNIFVNFEFEKVHLDNNTLIKQESIDEWTFIKSISSWQINSEFDKNENSDIVTERSSAVIMLVLDCSSSLANDFIKAQSNAKDFIQKLLDNSVNPYEVTSVSLDKTSINLAVGTSTALVPTVYPETALLKTVSWSSSDETIATVNDNGVVSGLKPGSATITVTTNDGNHKATCDINVFIPVSSISLNTTEVQLISGETASLSVSVLPENAAFKTVSWSSSDETIATVNQNGLVTGKSAGKVNITAKTTDDSNLTATCTIFVSDNTGGFINGYQYVDLGLPSGTKWATVNIGAQGISYRGNGFAWGETQSKTSFNENNSTTYKKDIADISGKPEYDAARAIWGASWRLPTKQEVEELINNCTCESQWVLGVGYGTEVLKVTGPNGRYITFPLSKGQSNLWSSTPSSGNTHAYNLCVRGKNSNGVSNALLLDNSVRWFDYYLRAVTN